MPQNSSIRREKQGVGSGCSSPFSCAAWAATILMVLCGIGYRMASGHLNQLQNGVALPKGTLAELPLEIATWSGRDVPLDERVVEATDTDDHIHRAYIDRNTNQQVLLFVAYGVRMRDLLPHRPEVCYPSAGWNLDRTTMESFEENGQSYKVQVHRFAYGGLEAKDITVLNYYIINDEHCPDVSLLRTSSLHNGGDVRYAAQVQIAASGKSWTESAEKIVVSFAEVSAKPIRDLLHGAVRRHTATAKMETP